MSDKGPQGGAAGTAAESAGALTFSLLAFRFTFRARDPLYFPPGLAGNTLRGAFGTILRRIACGPGCPAPPEGEHRADCLYVRIFEPAARTGPSGLADPPRPFVFRAARLDGRRFAAGEQFYFDVHLFDRAEPAVACFCEAFAELAREGFGVGRGRAELVSVERLDASRAPVEPVYRAGRLLRREEWEPIELNLEPAREPVRRVVVRFLTPTELKSGRRLLPEPEFGALFARIRDRVSTLRALYGPGPLLVDFRALGERAEAIRMARCELRWERAFRRSTRTGRRHPLGGFLGEAEYEGDLAEFLSYLRAAQWTGVGRHTGWGKGAIEVEAPPD